MSDVENPKRVVYDLRSPIPPIPKESFGKRLRRNVFFYLGVFAIVVAWAASSLVIAPVVQFGIDQAGAWMTASTASRQQAQLLDLELSIPCEAFETLPPGCDGLADEGPVRYGPSSVLYFWGRMPGLEGITNSERQKSGIPSNSADGVFYSLQKAFPNLLTGAEALAFARGEMAAYGAYVERVVAEGVTVFEAAEGSAARVGSFYAVYTRSDGLAVPVSCFGETCKLLQAPWREGFAYGITIAASSVAQLPAIDTAVRARLDGFAAPQS